MYANMEWWSEIRRRVLTGEMSKREACREYEIHWKILVKFLTHEEPPGTHEDRRPRTDDDSHLRWIKLRGSR